MMPYFVVLNRPVPDYSNLSARIVVAVHRIVLFTHLDPARPSSGSMVQLDGGDRLEVSNTVDEIAERLVALVRGPI